MFKKPFASNVSKRRLVSTLMSTHSSTQNVGQVFQLKSNREFASRLSSVFDGLKSVEAEHKEWQSRHEKNVGINKGDFNENADKKTLEIFKKPVTNFSRKRKIKPGYLMHPKKWKKYSLRDVPNHTEELNTAVAMQFLQNVKSKCNEQNEETAHQKVIFKKPLPVEKHEVKKSEVGSKHHYCCCSSSAFIMPEYVVGEKVQKTVKQKKNCSLPLSNVKLHHLESTYENDD